MVKPSVFVVDDEQMVTLRTESMLEEYGFETQSAASCRECLEKLEQGYSPHVVLIDIDLGEGHIDGAETARRIVRRYDLPVVFFSGHTDSEILAKTQGIRAYGYVYKDAGTDEFLVSTINMAIRLHRSEALLRESEEKFRTIFENSPIGLFRSTPQGRFLDVNQALAEMLGYSSPGEVLESISDIAKQIYVRTNDRKEIVSQTLSEEHVQHYENVYRRRDGSHFTADLYLKAIKDEWGNTLYLEGIVEDLTEGLAAERQLEEKNELFLQAIEVMHEGMIIVDEDGCIGQANKRAEEILDIQLSEMRGLVLWDLEYDWRPVHLDGTRFQRDELPSKVSLRTGESCRHVPIGLSRPDGQQIWLSVNTEALGGETGITGVVVSFREMTKEFNYQREIETILDSINASIYVADLETYDLLFLNTFARNIYGEVEGRKCWEVLQSGQEGPCAFCNNDRLFDEEGNPSEGIEREYQTTKGDRWYKIFDRAIWWYDHRYVRLEIVTDITDLKRLSEERKNLLVEMNHRIKNNLFTVEALAKIELSNSEKSKEESIRDIIGRVQAISLVHQKLYSTGNFTSIDAGGYLEDLGNTLSKAYASEQQSLDIHSTTESIRLPSKKISALGIIFVEFITNTQKYAERPKGCEIDITLSREGKNVVFEYRDNGVGFGDEVRTVDDVASGSGFMLIRALVNELGGKIEIVPKAASESRQGAGHDRLAGLRFDEEWEAFYCGVHLRVTFPLPSAPAETVEA